MEGPRSPEKPRAISRINWHQLASTGINWHQLASTGINWHQLAMTGIHWGLLRGIKRPSTLLLLTTIINIILILISAENQSTTLNPTQPYSTSSIASTTSTTSTKLKTMSLFRTIPAGGDFAPLFRLLDDYDNHRASQPSSSTSSSSSPSCVSMRSFTPRFDVRETSEGYHLDGELPGIAQKDVDIEFSDPQTLVIKGRTEREYHSSPDPDQDQGKYKSPEVEDEGEGEGERQVEKKQPASKRRAQHHYWVSERSVGEFQRAFSFPTRVDQDNVRASLKNGILSIVVPKAAAPVARKITVDHPCPWRLICPASTPSKAPESVSDCPDGPMWTHTALQPSASSPSMDISNVHTPFEASWHRLQRPCRWTGAHIKLTIGIAPFSATGQGFADQTSDSEDQT
ncbi:HSP20-like chaperone [Aspergillus heteromorphus CBS 117.55]|uniref:HSP20-like chaperone n=1 Tax=Aspergillus heteromorphus CBS 117.55 TaxID=1448321 RepID=A0A317WE52_9EURO|nr:HSP20-like chaperone [Aspergillus heteromorphus CBS 117.55]PWY84756.1 HSP20-like chaperone [Aspergillus heteromorphus CBS 117.55]